MHSNNYYPFGSPMPGRSYNSDASPNGFNGKRKDDEIKGNGNSYGYGAGIYDPHLLSRILTKASTGKTEENLKGEASRWKNTRIKFY